MERRKNYIDILVICQLEAGIPKSDKEIIIQGKSLQEFKAFCLESWEKSLELVDQAHKRQANRNKGIHV